MRIRHSTMTRHNCFPHAEASRHDANYVLSLAISGGCLPARALTVLAPGPATWPALAFFQLLPRPANAALSGHLLLGILDPADELIARQGRDVLPGGECRGGICQGLAQVRGKFVHHPTGHALAAHRARVTLGPAPPADRAAGLRSSGDDDHL